MIMRRSRGPRERATLAPDLATLHWPDAGRPGMPPEVTWSSPGRHLNQAHARRGPAVAISPPVSGLCKTLAECRRIVMRIGWLLPTVGGRAWNTRKGERDGRGVYDI
jgi:hypothetical protein